VQKIVSVFIDVENGDLAMRQITDAAGPGPWRIAALLDLHDTQGFYQWAKESTERPGRRVLAVLESEASSEKAAEVRS
jgi:hypothetical protein